MFKILKKYIEFIESSDKKGILNKNELYDTMKKLEMYTHQRIAFEHDGRFIPTYFGKLFYQYAKKALNILEEGIQIASQGNCYDFDNRLTIGISKDSASTWAINCIRNFNKLHPGLRISLITDDKLTQEMAEESTIIFWCVNEDLHNFDKDWYIEYKYGLYASIEYIQKHGMPTLSNLKDHKIIAYSGNDNNAHITNWHLHSEFGLPYLIPSIWTHSRDLIVKMTASGVGIGAISERQDVYYGYDHLVRVVELIDGPILKSYFMIRKGQNEQVQCNINLMSKLFKKYFLENGIKVYQN